MTLRPGVSILALSLALSIVLTIGALLGLQPEPVRSLPAPVAGAATSVARAEEAAFREVALELGINFSHQQNTGKLSALTETLGAGICVLDVNQDNWPDLFFVGGSGNRRFYGRAPFWYEKTGGNRLYVSTQNGTRFVDQTDQYGLGSDDAWGMGCAVGDLDNDEKPELIVYGIGENVLYRNMGTTFERVTPDPFGVAMWTSSAALADVNGDGLLDIYIANYIRYTQGARTLERFSGFDVEANRPYDATLYDAEVNQLFLNEGNFKFRDVAREFGVANAQGRSLTASWRFLNDDRWPDLIVANDHGTPNAVFLNMDGRGFQQAPEQLFALAMGGSHDLQPRDFDNNLHQDFVFSRGAGFNNALVRQQAIGRFEDVSRRKGTGDARWLFENGWGVATGDFNLDGLPDFVVANGGIAPDPDTIYIPTAQENALWLNDGNGQFVRAGSGVLAGPTLSSRSIVSVDLDNDGVLELVVGNNNATFEVYKASEAARNWLTVALDASDVTRVGASVEIVTSSGRQVQVSSFAQGFQSQGDQRIHFGLAGANEVSTLKVIWPDGEAQVFHDVGINHVVRVRSGTDLEVIEFPAVREARSVADVAKQWTHSETVVLVEVLQMLGLTDELKKVWAWADDALHIAMLERLRREDGLTSMLFVKQALDSPHKAIVLAGLDAAERLELDESVDWMLPLLASGDDVLVCRTSAVFAKFFEEEEAALRRKYLGVKPLIQRLASDDANGVACAARALSAAERKRAVEPLMRLLSASDIAVRTEAARSLGLIRDTRSRTALGPLVERDPSPDVAVSAMIASVRLGRDVHELFGVIERRFLREQLAIVDAMYRSEDTAVLPRERVNGLLAKIVDRGGEVEALTLAAMGASKDKRYAPRLKSYTRSKKPDLKKAAYISLAQLSAGAEYFENLAEDSQAFLGEVLPELVPVRLTPTTIEKLLQRGVSPSWLAPSIALLDKQGLRQVVESAAAYSVAEVGEVLSACNSSPRAPIDSTAYLQLSTDRLLSRDAIGCFLYNQGRPTEPKLRLARRIQVNSVLPRLQPEQKRDLLVEVAQHDSFFAARAEIKKVDASALDRLTLAQLDQGSVDAARVETIGADSRFSNETRLHAIKSLGRNKPEVAARLLEGMAQ